MKKIVLSIMAIMMTAVLFAQPVAVKSAQQKLSLSGAKQMKAERSLSIKPMVKNLQVPSNNTFQKVSRRAGEGEFSVNDLAGDYVEALFMYDYDSDAQQLVKSVPARKTSNVQIEVSGENEITIYGLLGLYGYNEAGIKATVNVDDLTITIPNKQVLGTNETYGDITMQNAETEGDFTGKIYSNGIVIDQLWMGSVVYQGNDVRFTDYYSTMLMFPNAIMKYTDNNKNDVETMITVEQDPETKVLTVYNFGDLNAVVDIDLQSNKTFTVNPDQVVDYSSTGGEFYPYALVGQNGLDIISGKCTSTTLTSDLSWTFYSEKGYWYGEQGPFTIEVTEDLEFPEVEKGVLVVAPEGLLIEDYPMTAKLYTETQTDYSTTVKLGWIGDTVYIQGIDKDFPTAWIKGGLNEKGYVVIAPTYTGSTEEGLSHFIGAYGGQDAGVDTLLLTYDKDAKTFEAAGTVMVYTGSKTTNYDYFFNGFFLGTKPSPVALPAGVETTEMPYTGKYMNERSTSEDPESVAGTVQVGRDGNDVYIGGLFANDLSTTGWLKGTFTNDSVVVFNMNQYTGVLGNGLSVYLVGDETFKTEGAGNVEIIDSRASDVVMIYNTENNFYTAINSVIITRFKSQLRPTAFYLSGLTIGSNPASIEGIKAHRSSAESAYYTLDGVRIAQPTKKGIYIHNGKKIVVK